MQLNQLYYFSEVVNMGSISKAANNLHISQPSLSTTIKNLETEFEQPLFKRTKHGVIPTEFGQRVYDDYMKIKHIIDGWYPKKESIKEECAGTININVMPSASKYFYEKLAFPFIKQHSNIQFFVSNAFLQTIFQDLGNSPSNIALLSISKNLEKETLTAIKQKGWHYHRIFSDKRVLCISTDHPLSKKSSLSKKDLKDLSLVYYSLKNDTISNMYLRYFKTAYHVASYNDVLMFMLQGKAVFLPLFHLSYLENYVNSGKLKIFDIPIQEITDEVPIYIITTDSITYCEQAFIDYVIQYFENNYK